MKIRKIEPVSQVHGKASRRYQKLKVACYVRVSSTKDEQKSSFDAQLDFYTNKIRCNSDWVFAGAYSDNGITGTNKLNRSGFNELIADALTGKIDLILTKSVSRFARNTVDTLQTIRKLKEKDVVVYFEKEDIWTNDSKGEFLLTLLSSFAQEESRSTSENVTWGHKRRFERGEYSVNFSWFLGYDRGPNGEFVINPEQAKVVKLIYKLYLNGYSIHGIAKELMRREIKSPSGRDTWAHGTVKSILTNEKYKGDALLQKYYTVDFLTHKQAKNNGELEQYYVKKGHKAIIKPEMFDYVQTLFRENKEKYIVKSRPFSHRIICRKCGAYYGSQLWHSTSYRNVGWKCKNRVRKTCRGRSFYNVALQIVLDRMFVKMCTNHIERLVFRALPFDDLKVRRIRENKLPKLMDLERQALFTDMRDWEFIIDQIVVDEDMWELRFADGTVQQIPFPEGTPKCVAWKNWSHNTKGVET